MKAPPQPASLNAAHSELSSTFSAVQSPPTAAHISAARQVVTEDRKNPSMFRSTSKHWWKKNEVDPTVASGSTRHREYDAVGSLDSAPVLGLRRRVRLQEEHRVGGVRSRVRGDAQHEREVGVSLVTAHQRRRVCVGHLDLHQENTSSRLCVQFVCSDQRLLSTREKKHEILNQ